MSVCCTKSVVDVGYCSGTLTGGAGSCLVCIGDGSEYRSGCSKMLSYSIVGLFTGSSSSEVSGIGESDVSVGQGLYTNGLAVQPKGMKWRGRSGPIGRRGTTRPFAKRKWVKVVPGFNPILTPSSVTGTFLKGVPVALEIARRLSSGCSTIAHRPNGTGCLFSLRPQTNSAGVMGNEALLVEWLSASPTAWSASSESSVGRW